MAVDRSVDLFIAKRLTVAHEMAVAEAPTAEEVKFAPEPAEESMSAPQKPAEAEIKKMRVVRVDKAFIDRFLRDDPFRPLPPMPDLSGCNPERQEGVRALLQRVAAGHMKDRDFCADLLEQYRAKGYVEIASEEVSDDVAETYIAKIKARRGV